MSKPKRIKRPIDGVLLLDKPYGMSSNQALQRCRWLFEAEKAGHTGVLDPLATGLLPLCFGEATKFAQRMLDAQKRYHATLKLGITTTTGDLEGEVLETRDVSASREEVERVVRSFLGASTQIPPMYSALKHEGKSLYEYARQGLDIERKPREIEVYRADVLEFSGDTLMLDVEVSKGTYIRTLGEDIGRIIGCGAHLTGLRRTLSGGFDILNAVTIEQLEHESMVDRDARLLPSDCLLADLPEMTLDLESAQKITFGLHVRFLQIHETIPLLRLYGDAGDGLRQFLGVGELRDHVLYPRRLLSTVAKR